MFITKMHIARRTFLRGVGATLALPFLDAMVPARTLLAATAAKAPLRFSFLYVPHGAIMESWTPEEAGADFELSRALKPLAPVREHVNVLSNLMFVAPGSHPLSSVMWLSGKLPRSTSAEDVYTAITIDQMIADQRGQDTLFPSLELAVEDFSMTGACEPGFACVLQNTLSWRTPTTPLPNETNPRVLFERMFGDGSSEANRQARRSEARSILDAVSDDMKQLHTKLGPSDRNRMDAYLDNVREVERRIQKAEKQGEVALPEPPGGIPESYEEHVKLMFDLLGLAYQGDITRVGTLMLARELSQQSYSWLGNTDGHHVASHHQGNPTQIEEVVRINAYHVSLFARFVERMRQTPDGDGTLLDHMAILYGSGMSNGNGHTHDPLPILMAGGANGQLKTGRHIVYPRGTRMSNLLLNILDMADIHEERLADSTGRLQL